MSLHFKHTRRMTMWLTMKFITHDVRFAVDSSSGGSLKPTMCVQVLKLWNICKLLNA